MAMIHPFANNYNLLKRTKACNVMNMALNYAQSLCHLLCLKTPAPFPTGRKIIHESAMSNCNDQDPIFGEFTGGWLKILATAVVMN